MNAKIAGAHAIASSGQDQRRRIWEINPSMHCSVVGTCLSIHDLYTIARRAGCPLNPMASTYDVHSWFVDCVAFPNEVSKLVDKALEKRHGRSAQPVRRARTQDEIEVQWKEVAERGQIAGAYWGAMSHPRCSMQLQWRLFGEIHMLSHLMGASRSSERCKVHELEVACASLEDKLAQLKHDHRALQKDRDRLSDALGSRSRELERSERRWQNARERIAALESQTLASELEARSARLERELQDAQARATAAETALSATRTLLGGVRFESERASAQARELLAENEALELELSRMVTEPSRGAEQDQEGALDLGGSRILYVGGRVNLVPHYRALIELRGGEFLHHDGGLEDSLEILTRAFSTVDVVMCPVDCVSHAACLKVKRACKRLAKRFIPLRSSGLSSFARGLRALSAPEGEARPRERALGFI